MNPRQRRRRAAPAPSPMPIPQHASELLAAILTGPLPADRAMERHFREHRSLGQRERGWVAETVYACLRRKRTLEIIAGSDHVDFLVAACLIALQENDLQTIERFGLTHLPLEAIAARARGFDARGQPAAIANDLPDWLQKALVTEYGETETALLAQALNQPATLDLRVNTLKATREQARQRMQDEGVETQLTPLSPWGLRRNSRSPLFRSASFQEGWIEVQDEGSQLLAPLLEPKRGEIVVDYCAGGGGKTLHLAALLNNTGMLYAFDISARRLDRLKLRARRAGLSNVRTIAIERTRDDRIRRLAGKADRVLVDAPCSGTGTLRRNPDVKWRHPDLAALAKTQYELLESAAGLVKPGGRLVYATCSLLHAENQAVIEAFLAKNAGFRPIPINDILRRREIQLEMSSDKLSLLPHLHHTDGFTAYALVRES